MKITKSELMQIINEEVQAYKKVKLLENRRNQILRQLNEMEETYNEAKICSECGRPMEEGNMEEGVYDTVKKVGKKIVQTVEKGLGLVTGKEKEDAIDLMLKTSGTGYPKEIQKALKDKIESGEKATEESVKKELFDILMKKPIEKNEKTGMWSMYESSLPTRLLWDSETKSWKSAQSAAKVTGTAGSAFSEGKK